MRSLVALLFILVAGPLTAADANFHLYLLIGQSNMAGRGKEANEAGALSKALDLPIGRKS